MAFFTRVRAVTALVVVVMLVVLAVAVVKVVVVRSIAAYVKPAPSLSIVTWMVLPPNMLTPLKSRVELLVTKFCKLTNSLLYRLRSTSLLVPS